MYQFGGLGWKSEGALKRTRSTCVGEFAFVWMAPDGWMDGWLVGWMLLWSWSWSWSWLLSTYERRVVHVPCKGCVAQQAAVLFFFLLDLHAPITRRTGTDYTFLFLLLSLFFWVWMAGVAGSLLGFGSSCTKLRTAGMYISTEPSYLGLELGLASVTSWDGRKRRQKAYCGYFI